ncbi:hypothetical protein ACE1TH_12925 [Shouchella sp. JSM 1781072]|uniref:hypothetical protein n=1 Tax=Bacillaceae TaxID=186817 RepID=UPI000C080966|nr:hypothetical protein [Bacillus sp. Marseille-P3800]
MFSFNKCNNVSRYKRTSSNGGSSLNSGPPGPPGPPGPTEVKSFGSLRGSTIENPSEIESSVIFNEVGTVSGGITPSSSGNEFIVLESGVYQITLSISPELSLSPDPSEPYLSAVITINGGPAFGDATSAFYIKNRSSSSFIIQADLVEGDVIGANIATSSILGYIGRSLTLLKVS